MAHWAETLLPNHKDWSFYPQDAHKKLGLLVQCAYEPGLEKLRQEAHLQGSLAQMV